MLLSPRANVIKVNIIFSLFIIRNLDYAFATSRLHISCLLRVGGDPSLIMLKSGVYSPNAVSEPIRTDKAFETKAAQSPQADGSGKNLTGLSPLT